MVEPAHDGSLQVERRAGRWLLRGQIDETSGLSALANDVGADALGDAIEIDLSSVTYINSLGVREWVVMMQRLTTLGIAVTLVGCSEPMVQQFNMIINARGPAQVESFHTPFACDTCGWEGTLMLATSDVTRLLESRRLPSGRCPDCASPARFNDFIDRYFLFLG